MRITVNHPDLARFFVYVFVDGVEQRFCVEADDED